MKQALFLLALGTAGALGTLGRYGIGQATNALTGSDYPWGTFFVNILGCLLFGVVAGFFISETSVSNEWKIILSTGLLGGFTTFSAFAFENHAFLRDGRYTHLLFHVVGQNLLGILAVFLGLFLVEKWMAR